MEPSIQSGTSPTVYHAPRPQPPAELRLAVPTDTAAINRLLQLAYPEEMKYGLRLPYHPKAYQHSAVLVATTDLVVGVLFVMPGLLPGSALLNSLVIDPAYRSRGIGTELVTAGIQHASTVNMKRVYTIFDKNNLKAQELCGRLGLLNSHATIQDEWCREQVEYYRMLDESFSIDFLFLRTLSRLREQVGTSGYHRQLKAWSKLLKRELRDQDLASGRLRQLRGLWQRMTCFEKTNPDEVTPDLRKLLAPDEAEHTAYLLTSDPCQVRLARDEDADHINKLLQLCFPEDYEAQLARPYQPGAYRYGVTFVAECDGVVVGSEIYLPGASSSSVLMVGSAVHPDFRGRHIYSALAQAAKAYLLKRKILWHYAYVLMENTHMQRILPRFGYTKQPFLAQDERCRLTTLWNRVLDPDILLEFQFSYQLEELRKQLGDIRYRNLLAQWNEHLTEQLEAAQLTSWLQPFLTRTGSGQNPSLPD